MTTLAALAHRGTPITVSEAETVLSNAIGVQNALAAWDVLAPLTGNLWVPDIAVLMQRFRDEDRLEFIKIYAKHTKPNLLLLHHFGDNSQRYSYDVDYLLKAWRICVRKRISLGKHLSSKKLADIINHVSERNRKRYKMLKTYTAIDPVEYSAEIMNIFPERYHIKVCKLLTNVPAAFQHAADAKSSAALATPNAVASAAAPSAVVSASTTTGCALQIATNQLKGPAVFAARGENYVTRVNGFTNGSCGGAITSTTVRTNGITRGHKTVVPKCDALTLNGVTVRVSTMRPTVTYALGPETVVVLKNDGNLHVEGVIHDDTMRGGI